MNITISSRHFNMDDRIKEYADKKIHKAETYFDSIMEANMVLSAEKHRRIAEVTISAKRATFHAREVTENIYASIDGVMDKIDKQLRRHKEKIKDKKHDTRMTLSDIPAEEEITEIEDIEEDENGEVTEAQIIKVNKFAPKPITVQEAVNQIEISGNEFLMFSNSQTNQVNVIYKRTDGNYGWIEPDFE
ncbi:ribosome-associated translation inhibitor RaiA [Candidatus Poribacteria bacterium]|nr:ribosome-associated translation inhibitor RaiA [Candidatus Poribacteria bacterium]